MAIRQLRYMRNTVKRHATRSKWLISSLELASLGIYVLHLLCRVTYIRLIPCSQFVYKNLIYASKIDASWLLGDLEQALCVT